MSNVTFITGNQGKADFLAKHLGHPVGHKKLDLDEIQSLDLRQVAGHKAAQAFSILKKPVLVEDVSLTLEGLNKLPGPFIKWFNEALGLEGCCRLVDKLASRKATVAVCFCYKDQNQTEFFYGELSGTIAEHPVGENGFGFDPVFIPSGSKKTLAQMTDAELEVRSLRTTTVYPKIKEFLARLDKIS